MFGLMLVKSDRLKRLEEAVNTYTRSLEDVGWINLSLEGGEQLDVIKEGFQKMLQTCRQYYYRNPLAGHWVNLTTYFVFGEGISKPKAKDPKVQEVIDSFWDDSDNKKALTSYQAQEKLSNKLQYEGNVFFALFEDDEANVRVRVLNTQEVTDIIRDPDDRLRPRFYKVQQKSAKFSFRTDAYEISGQKYIYYRDYENADDPADAGVPPEKQAKAVVYHVKINCDINDKFGVPELYRGLDWIKAHKDMAGDLATLIKSLSTLAWKKKVKGTAAQVNALKAAAHAKADLTNPAKIVGSTQYENEAIDTQAIATPTGGAVLGEKGLKQMQLMVCAASHIFYHYFGDPETGNLATATTMELPMVKKFLAYQALWKSVFLDILLYVIHKKIEVGIFPGAFDYNDKTDRMVYETEVDLNIDIDFPPIIEKDIKVTAEALEIAKRANLIADETAASIFLLAAGQNNIEEEIKKIDFTREPFVPHNGPFPTGGQPDGPEGDGKRAPAGRQAAPEGSTAGNRPVSEALATPERKMAIRLAKKGNYVMQRMNGYRKAIAMAYGRWQDVVRESVRVSGIEGKVVGHVVNLEEAMEAFRRSMQQAARSYFPVAIDIGRKYAQAHLQDKQIRDTLFEANGRGQALLDEKLAWNVKFLAESLAPDMEEKVMAAVRTVYENADDFKAAVASAAGSFEGRLSQYAGAFWSVEESAVKEAGKGTGLMVNFAGADDSHTCEGCNAAMERNPYLIDEAPEPGSHECNGRCRHALQIINESEGGQQG